MQITVEEQSPIKKTLCIEIPQETVARELEETYQKLKKTASIKGFRPGKVPMSIIKGRYQEQVKNDVTYQLIQNTLPEAVKEKELDVIGEPEITPSELNEEAPFTYNATVELKPEIADLDIDGLQLQKVCYSYSDAEIDNQMAALQNNFAEESPLDPPRPAQMDDIAYISYEGFHNGQPLEDFPKTENTKFTIGSNFISPDFDGQILGLTPGESKSVSVDFPAEEGNPNVAGKTVTFEVTLNALYEKQLPALDDDFAKKIGPYETLAQLREEVAQNLQSGYDKRSQQELSEQVFEKLLEKSDFEVPETMIKHELQGILEEIERTYANYNLSLEALGQSREGLQEQYRDTAIKQAKRHMLLNKIIEQEELTISEEALENGFQEIADSMQQPVDMVKQFYQQRPEQIDVLRYSLLEKQAMDMLLEKSQIEEVAPPATEDETAAAGE